MTEVGRQRGAEPEASLGRASGISLQATQEKGQVKKLLPAFPWGQTGIEAEFCHSPTVSLGRVT